MKLDKCATCGGCGCLSCAPPGFATADCMRANPGGLTRTHFFGGMLLTQADLANEQEYWRAKRKLTNRALGRGVVWGLATDVDPRRGTIHVEPGYAIDCCGNDIVIACPIDVPISEVQPQRKETTWQRAYQQGLGHAYLVLDYVECPQDPRPLHSDACTSDGSRFEPTRIRESSRLRLAPVRPERVGPISEFQTELDRLRELCPELFPFVEEEGGESNEVPADLLSLQLRTPAGWNTVEQVTFREGASGSLPFTLGRREDEGPLELAVALRVRDGFVWTSGRVVFQQESGAEIEAEAPAAELLAEVEPPFATEIVWRIEIDSESDGEYQFRLEDWRAARLLGESLAVTGDPITIELDIRDGQVTAIAFHAPNAQSSNDYALSDCFDRLIPLLWQEGAGEVFDADPRVLLLAGVHAWLTHVGANHGPNTWSGPRVAVTWIYLITWRLLYGGDTTAPNENDAACHRRQLAQILHNLLRKWCAGLVYPGPLCGEDHGVVLGTAVLDPFGRIQSFDAWAGRRHVLTGPLLSHWGGMVGLAPLDVVAGRIAGTICCLAGLPTPTLPALPPWSITALVGEDAELEQRIDEMQPNRGTLATDGITLIYGSLGHVEQLAAEQAVMPITESEEVGWFDFFGKLLDGPDVQDDASPIGFRRVYPRGRGDKHLQLITPIWAEAEGGEYDYYEMVGSWSSVDDQIPPQAKKAVREAGNQMVLLTPVEALAPAPGDEAAWADASRALEASGIATLGQLLRLDPEIVASRMPVGNFRSAQAHAEAVDIVLSAGRARARTIAEAWAKAAAESGRGFRRARMGDDAFVDKVQGHLRDAGLPETLTSKAPAVAGRVAKRKPNAPPRARPSGGLGDLLRTRVLGLGR